MFFEQILEYAMKQSHFQIRKLIGKYGFQEADVEDLQQEILLDLLQRWPRYDRSKSGAKTFVCRVINHHIANLLRERQAACRDFRREACSLDDWRRDETGNWVRRGELMDERLARTHTGQVRRSPEELTDLILDVMRVINQLPPDLKNLCLALRFQTVVEISQETGQSRAQIYKKIGAIRRLFQRAGLKIYLPDTERGRLG